MLPESVFVLWKRVHKWNVDSHFEPLGRVHPFGAFVSIVSFVQVKIDPLVPRKEVVTFFKSKPSRGSN